VWKRNSRSPEKKVSRPESHMGGMYEKMAFDCARRDSEETGSREPCRNGRQEEDNPGSLGEINCNENQLRRNVKEGGSLGARHPFESVREWQT